MEAEIGIIGGSGLYSLLENPHEAELTTKYGKPSSAVSVGEIDGRKVAFIARHGKKHTIPPHKVPYRANIEAFAQLGVTRVVTTNAIGSFIKAYKPGDFVFMDQFINMTHSREDTFYDKDEVVHISTAHPYCDVLRKHAIEVAKKQNIAFHETGTIVVVNGPRFSTKAESKLFSAMGAQVINMTQYPEVALAREKEMCYAGIGMVTDYDAGLDGVNGIVPVSHAEVARTFANNIEKVKRLIYGLIPEVPQKRTCACREALKGARIL